MNEIEVLELKLAKMHTEAQDVYRLLVSKKEEFLRSLLTNPSLDESKMKKAYYLEDFCVKFFIAELWYGQAQLKKAHLFVRDNPVVLESFVSDAMHFPLKNERAFNEITTDWFLSKGAGGKSIVTANGYFLQFLQVQASDEVESSRSFIFALLKEGEDHTMTDGLPANSHGFFKLDSYADSYGAECFHKSLTSVTFEKRITVRFY